MGDPKIDHIAIAVHSIEEALLLFRDVLGGEFLNGGDNDRLGFRAVQLRLPPGVKIELIQPIAEDSPYGRFLEKRGPGMHHLTVLVDNVETVIWDLEHRGFEVTGTDLSSPKWRETYVRPRSGFGILLQLVDSIKRWDIPADVSLDDVLAGRVIYLDHEPTLRAAGQEPATEPS